MTQEHPITPPPELVQQWRDLPEFTDGRRKMIMVTLSREKLLDIATQAARWGADQELEACCEILRGEFNYHHLAEPLRAARRPKPPSLKEQALIALETWAEDKYGIHKGLEVGLIHRALEQLDD